MDYKLIIGLWLVLAVSIIYWDINKNEDNIPLDKINKEGITGEGRDI